MLYLIFFHPSPLVLQKRNEYTTHTVTKKKNGATCFVTTTKNWAFFTIIGDCNCFIEPQYASCLICFPRWATDSLPGQQGRSDGKVYGNVSTSGVDCVLQELPNTWCLLASVFHRDKITASFRIDKICEYVFTWFSNIFYLLWGDYGYLEPTLNCYSESTLPLVR